MPLPGPLHVRLAIYRPTWHRKEPPRRYRAVLRGG